MRRLLVLLALEGAAVAGLVAAAPTFVRDGRVEDPIATVLWAIALALAAWLLLSTAASAAVEAAPRVPRWLGAVVRRTTLPAVRAAVAGALTFGSATLTTSAAFAADTTPPTVRTGRDITVVEPEPPASPPSPASPPTASVPPSRDAATEHRVIPGDNLWTIAADHLGAHVGRRPAEPEVARYWALVVEVNRARVRSGDPDLIFPGELVTLPPL